MLPFLFIFRFISNILLVLQAVVHLLGGNKTMQIYKYQIGMIKNYRYINQYKYVNISSIYL